jgi:hypothetical protein
MGYFNEQTKAYEEREALRRFDGNPSYYEKAWHDFVARLSKEQQLCPDCNGSGGLFGEGRCDLCRGYGALDLAGKPSQVVG